MRTVKCGRLNLTIQGCKTQTPAPSSAERLGEQSQRLSAATSAIKLAKGRSFSISVATVKLGRTGPERGVGGQVTHLGST
jgi:hypothetical protein